MVITDARGHPSDEVPVMPFLDQAHHGGAGQFGVVADLAVVGAAGLA